MLQNLKRSEERIVIPIARWYTIELTFHICDTVICKTFAGVENEPFHLYYCYDCKYDLLFEDTRKKKTSAVDAFSRFTISRIGSSPLESTIP